SVTLPPAIFTTVIFNKPGKQPPPPTTTASRFFRVKTNITDLVFHLYFSRRCPLAPADSKVPLAASNHGESHPRGLHAFRRHPRVHRVRSRLCASRHLVVCSVRV